MKITTNKAVFKNGMLTVQVPSCFADEYAKLARRIEQGKYIDITLANHNEKRSLSANALLWEMLGKMARVLDTTSEELYLHQLRMYGPSLIMAVEPKDVLAVRLQYRLVEELEKYNINGTEVIALQVWKGTSEYNSAEFAKLLDGTIEDAKALGVDYACRADRDAAMERLGKTELN